MREVVEIAATVYVLARYWSVVVPLARSEIRRWCLRAEAIPDLRLRAYAVGTLTGEALNAEAAAVFALLAPRRHRRAVTRLTVAFQVLYDYLDTLTEEPVDDMSEVGLQLHHALTLALEPPGTRGGDVYERVVGDDGGYVASLVQACQAGFASLPSAGSLRGCARRAARRCGEAQTYTHVSAVEGREALVRWSLAEAQRYRAFRWWEIAAAGISSLAVHALLAAAASAVMRAGEAAAIDAAYFPSICAISTLLDSLVDREDDRRSGNLNYVSEYGDDMTAAQRLGWLGGEATKRLERVPDPRVHRVILAGVAGFYLSAAEARSADAVGVTRAVIECFKPGITPILATLRLRREIRRRRDGG